MRVWFLALAVSIPWLGGGENQKNKEGARLYEAGNLDEALAAFTQALVESPDAPEIHYNIGNVHYRKEAPDKALEEYRAALRGAAGVQHRAHYNIGNVLFRGQRFDGAVEAYKEALKIDPGDLEARQNLELALQALEKEKQPGGGGGSTGKDEEKEEEPEPRDQPEASPQKGEPGGGMSKEEAERILAALAQMEKAEQKEQLQKKQPPDRRKSKDW